MRIQMKTLILLSAVLALHSASSLAADLPAKASVVPAATPWSGLYLGLNGGMNLGSFSPIFGSGPAATEVNLDDNNWFVGGHIGYLVQNGNFVVGPEFGVQYWGTKAKASLPMGDEVVATFQQKIDWLAYANVRGGVTVFPPKTLLYVTAGAAWAHVKNSANINIVELGSVNEQSVFGWNIGAGVEFKITEYVTFGGEYRHYDFGKVDALNPALALELGGLSKLTVDQAMARLSYRLN